MSLLLLVRHGKASPMTDDYDQLSELGFEQSRLLGHHFADARLTFDAVYVGPRKRHAQTLECVASAYRARGLAWPEPVRIDELDEHQGVLLLYKLLPRLAEEDPSMREVAEAMARGEMPALQGMLATFKSVTRRWVRGEIGHDDIEPWSGFRGRVARALEAMTASGRKKTVVAFTSAGAVAAAIGEVLSTPDEKVLDMSWALHNGSFSEVAFSDGGLGMKSFNATPHLRDARLVTSV
jgi:broad specificity phosphatase PhoE